MQALNIGTGVRRDLRQHCNSVVIITDGSSKKSVEYAKARKAIDMDFQENFKMNQPLAKRVRKESKQVVVQALGGKVSRKKEEGKDGQPGKERLIVTFSDSSIAYL